VQNSPLNVPGMRTYATTRVAGDDRIVVNLRYALAKQTNEARWIRNLLSSGYESRCWLPIGETPYEGSLQGKVNSLP
jgi:hypothetical protein